jgi:hypothetical protein
MTAAPQNGTQAHDLSRELEFGRPAQVGATPFWDAAARGLALLGPPHPSLHKTTEYPTTKIS